MGFERHFVTFIPRHKQQLMVSQSVRGHFMTFILSHKRYWSWVKVWGDTSRLLFLVKSDIEAESKCEGDTSWRLLKLACILNEFRSVLIPFRNRSFNRTHTKLHLMKRPSYVPSIMSNYTWLIKKNVQISWIATRCCLPEFLFIKRDYVSLVKSVTYSIQNRTSTYYFTNVLCDIHHVCCY